MENSILTSTKKILGIAQDYTAFDLDIMTHINSTFSLLNQLGIGVEGYYITDSTPVWADFTSTGDYNMVRSYVFLKVRMLFDPPSTSFLITAMEKQIEEYEWRLMTKREWLLDPVDPRIEGK